MVSRKEIKSIAVNGQEYDYIESVTSGGVTYKSTTFIQFAIPSNYEEAFKLVGGYTREVLYNKQKDLDVNGMTILTTVTENGLNVAYFLFEKDGVIVETVASVEEVFLPHAIDFIIEQESVLGKIEIENSLTYLGDTKYGKYMENYEEPTSLLQSGLKIGEEDVLFGEKLIIRGLTQVQDMLEGDFLKVVRDEGLDALEVQVWDKVGAFDTVTSDYLLKEDGSVYTYFDNLRFSMGKDVADAEIREADVQDSLEGIHKRINKHKKLLQQQGLTEDEVTQGVEDFKKRVRYTSRVESAKESLKELDEPYVLLLSRRGLNTLLRNPNIRVERISKG